MNPATIYHRPLSEFAFATDATHYVFRLRTGKGEARSCRFFYADRAAMVPELDFACLPMKKIREDRYFDWYEVRLETKLERIAYWFELSDGAETLCYFGDCYEMAGTPTRADYFQLPFNHRADRLSVPEWTKDAVVYNIFPDSFADGFRTLSGGSDGKTGLGGTIRGITENLDYIASMGFNCIYLNPIFAAESYHRYDTLDYYQVDPHMGSKEDVRALVEKAHSLGIRVLLDGVFNHSGIHFPPFEDLLKNGEESRYRGWFYPKRFPIEIDPACYECVGDYPYMPRLNGANGEVRAYVRDVLLYWLREAGIDGWRFDVADELDRHAVIWWREEIKREFPQAVLLGETWGDASRLLGADGFDTAMNYLFRDAVTDCLARGRIGVSELSRRLNSALMKVTGPNGHAMYNCLGSHDTARFLTEAKGEAWRLRLAMALQMLFPGAPAIYYGDELGMTGENDPGCRGGMAWAHPDKDLLVWQKELIALRQAHPALRTGSYTPLLADDEKSLFAFARGNREEELLAVFNLGERAQTWDCAGESVHVLPHSVHILFRPVQKEEKPCVQKPSWRSSPA